MGRRLFHEKKLSSDGSVACASCHNPALGFSDGLALSHGINGRTGLRNAPSITNAAYNNVQFWDGRALSLERQIEGPLTNVVEMNQTHEACVSKLGADPTYRSDFMKAFGPGPITISKVDKAIASFERTLLSGNSSFDEFEYGGKENALTPKALRGLAAFRDPDKGNCASCHIIGEHTALFTDHQFHNIGVGVNDEGEVVDVGRFAVDKVDANRGAFKTPSLRNVAVTAPYMHDGRFKTLKEVVDYYAGGGNSNPNLDPRVKGVRLTGQDRSDLVEFLSALTSRAAAVEIRRDE